MVRLYCSTWSLFCGLHVAVNTLSIVMILQTCWKKLAGRRSRPNGLDRPRPHTRLGQPGEKRYRRVLKIGPIWPKIFVVQWGCLKYYQNVDCNELQWSESWQDLYRHVTSSEADSIPGKGNTTTFCCVAFDGHRWPTERATQKMVQLLAVGGQHCFYITTSIKYPCL